jgi:hypothetical protein
VGKIKALWNRVRLYVLVFGVVAAFVAVVCWRIFWHGKTDNTHLGSMGSATSALGRVQADSRNAQDGAGYAQDGIGKAERAIDSATDEVQASLTDLTGSITDLQACLTKYEQEIQIAKDERIWWGLGGVAVGAAIVGIAWYIDHLGSR